MAINFPSSPTLNDVYSYGGQSYIWTGSTWDLRTATDIIGLPTEGLTNGCIAVYNASLGIWEASNIFDGGTP